VYGANLSFGRCGRYLGELLGMGLIEVKTGSPPTWAITERGREFLEKRGELKGVLSRDRRGGAGTAKVRIELDPGTAEKLREALERAEPVEEEPAEEKRRPGGET